MDFHPLKTTHFLHMIRQAIVVSATLILLACSLDDAAPAAAQASSTITPPIEVESTLVANTTDSYTFNAPLGAVLSFSVRATDPTFDPVLTILDSQGREVIANDDYNYPESGNALLEAITIPRTGTYSVQVSGFEGSGGAYSLRAYPGYSEIAALDSFDRIGGLAILNDTVTASVINGVVDLAYQGVRGTGAVIYEYVDPIADFYAEMRVNEVNNSSGWIVGMAVRRQRENYYALHIRSDGLWRFVIVEDGTEEVLRDWTPHPALVAGQTTFDLGVMANNDGFDFYYNRAYIGSVTDSRLPSPGGIGIVVGGSSSLTSRTNAQIDDLIITSPHFVNGARVLPDRVIVTSGADMVRALEQRHIVNPNGTMALTVPESSVEFARAGVNRLMLGRGTTYTEFALGAMVQINAGAPNRVSGCGLIFHFQDETDYMLAYLDAQGGYGMSQRQGDTFLPGLFGENPEWGEDQHHLLVIADSTTLYYYIDGQLVGTLNSTAQTGEVGTAVVNFETITTSCLYRDLWLWQWE